MIRTIQDWTRYLLYVEDMMCEACDNRDTDSIIRLNLVWHMAKNEIISLQAQKLSEVA